MISKVPSQLLSGICAQLNVNDGFMFGKPWLRVRVKLIIPAHQSQNHNVTRAPKLLELFQESRIDSLPLGRWQE